MANTALGNRFYGLVLVKPDLKEVQKANYQSLACHTGPENDLVASLWPGGGSLWDPALASVPSLHLSGSFPHAWVHSSHLNSLALALSPESLPYLSSRPSKNILIHSWWCLVDSVCLFSENSELIFLRTTLWHRAVEGP